MLAARGGTLTGVWFDGQKHMPEMSGWVERALPHPLLDKTQGELARFFDGAAARFDDLTLDDSVGSDFQRLVWRELQTIEPGKTRSYGEIAASVGRPGAARAVGSAVAKNPWSVVVPCHRVVGKAGALTGYAGGLERKEALLKLEEFM